MPTWYISIFSSTGPSFNLSSVSRIRIFGVNCCYNQPVICGLGLWVLVVILPSLQIVTCYNQQIHETEAPIELIFLVPQQIVTFFFLFFCFPVWSLEDSFPSRHLIHVILHYSCIVCWSIACCFILFLCLTKCLLKLFCWLSKKFFIFIYCFSSILIK